VNGRGAHEGILLMGSMIMKSLVIALSGIGRGLCV
jgi:hypothetical protein